MELFKEIKAEELQENPFEKIGKDWMLITAKNGESVNTMTASWGGLGVMWHKNVAFVVIRPQRYTKEFVDSSDSFSLSFYDEKYKKNLSYLGSISGRDENKIEKTNFNMTYDADTPFFTEASVVLKCRKLFAMPFEEQCFIDKSIISTHYREKDYHTLYIAEIEKVLVKN